MQDSHANTSWIARWNVSQWALEHPALTRYLMIVLMVPMFLMPFIPRDPNGPIATVTSWIPSPVVMAPNARTKYQPVQRIPVTAAPRRGSRRSSAA